MSNRTTFSRHLRIVPYEPSGKKFLGSYNIKLVLCLFDFNPWGGKKSRTHEESVFDLEISEQRSEQGW